MIKQVMENRYQSKTFWTSVIALIAVLANQIASIYHVDISETVAQVVDVTETILLILGTIGIIHHPNSKGFGYSQRISRKRGY